MRLVIGPTSAGKSTYLRRLKKTQPVTIHQAWAVLDEGGEIPLGEHDYIHYNLLRGFRAFDGDSRVELLPELVSLVDAAEEVIVLMAPVPVLARRAEERHERTTEKPTPYEQGWIRALRKPRVAQVCEQLALHLDLVGKPARYLCSNADVHGDYAELSRWDFPRLAHENGAELCAQGHRQLALDVDAGTYQADYNPRATGAKRAATLVKALTMPLGGKRLLDVGAAEGAASLSAARMGAKVTAVEPRRKRYDQLQRIASGLGIELDARNLTLDGVAEPSNSFDVVVCFNVIHHVPDPFAFLDRLADLTRSHLVLEYPDPQDKKFRKTVDDQTPVPEQLPMLGVSLPSAGQTFVFTPASLDVYLRGLNGIFGKHEIIESPIANRWISIFSDKLKPVESAELKLRQEVAALKQRVRELESSTSWKVTKPIRVVGGLRRKG